MTNRINFAICRSLQGRATSGALLDEMSLSPSFSDADCACVRVCVCVLEDGGKVRQRAGVGTRV